MALRVYREPVVAPAPARVPAKQAPARPARAIDPFGAGNSAAAMVIQRESRADALAWLKGLLAKRGALSGVR